MTQFKQHFLKLNQFVKDSDNILVVVHENPDGDGLGSMLALASYFKKLDKNHTLFSKDKVQSFFYFLPGVENIVSEVESLNLDTHDLIIFADCGDLERSYLTEHLLKNNLGKYKIVNIDHHSVSADYKKRIPVHIEIIDEQVSSTAEIIYHFFQAIEHEIDKETATCLLTGILTDTGSFSNLATTPASLEVASDLLKKGVNMQTISNNTLKNKSLNTLKLWGRALSRLSIDEKTGVVTTALTQKDFKECEIDDPGTEGISNFLNNIPGAKYTLLLKEEKENRIKGSLRTTTEGVDVSKIAQNYGGGGHKRAAGFSTNGKIEKTENGWRIVK